MQSKVKNLASISPLHTRALLLSLSPTRFMESIWYLESFLNGQPLSVHLLISRWQVCGGENKILFSAHFSSLPSIICGTSWIKLEAMPPTNRLSAGRGPGLWGNFHAGSRLNKAALQGTGDEEELESPLNRAVCLGEGGKQSLGSQQPVHCCEVGQDKGASLYLVYRKRKVCSSYLFLSIFHWMADPSSDLTKKSLRSAFGISFVLLVLLAF